MECTKLNCPMQVGTVTYNCGDSCPWRTTVKLDDLISRAAAIEWFFRPYSNEEYYSNIDVSRALKAIPAVDAIPVGWLEDKELDYRTTGDKMFSDAFAVVIGEWQKEQEVEE